MNHESQNKLALCLLGAPCGAVTERNIAEELRALQKASPLYTLVDNPPYSRAAINLLSNAAKILSKQQALNEASEMSKARRFLKWLRDLPDLPRDVPSWVMASDVIGEESMTRALWRDHAPRLQWQDTAT
jgi:hypothetical protein